MLQHRGPQVREDAGLDPLLEPSVAGGAGAVLSGQRLPLAAGAQDVENAIQDLAEGHDRPPGGAGRFLGREQGVQFGPQIVGDAPDGAETSLRRHG